MNAWALAVAGYAVIAAMISAYVLLDGFDLGVGAISLWIGKTDGQRAEAMEAIAPFWNGNEVWLIAAGAALFALFPRAYASSFSGFYLPFIVVLWLLMFRGIALELRGHFNGELWHQFWDAAFSLSSALLILVFGVALGNLLRGVPLDALGYFRGTFGFLLNPYALGAGLFALAALANHGAAFLAYRTGGELQRSARRVQRAAWWVVVALYVALTVATYFVRGIPPIALSAAMTVASVAAIVAMKVARSRNRDLATFLASSVFIASLLVEAAGSMFPYLLPGYPMGSGGLSIFDAAPSTTAVACALAITVGGGIAVLVYGTWVARRLGATK
ncbi:MAG: cytochrome d ubiquinol oxidase subunit II [Candidatus Eremiobacteraeota bacterium]|nr:cytochrome d ubiquinol oxidase subunit II [Candidatus Eremiobacteraeota bacterium]